LSGNWRNEKPCWPAQRVISAHAFRLSAAALFGAQLAGRRRTALLRSAAWLSCSIESSGEKGVRLMWYSAVSSFLFVNGNLFAAYVCGDNPVS